jgi:short-subunit dehydrogenase
MFYKNRRALITGASKGLGAVFADRLAAKGADLVLVARSGDKLQALAGRLVGEHGVKVQVVVQDLCLAGSVERVLEAAGGDGQRVDLLVNNAGFGTFGRFEALPLERQLQEILLNVSALTELSHRCLPAMLAHKFGGILNVASTAAFQPLAFMATYAATKAYVLSFSEALWAENQGSGVNICALCPGPVQTEFFSELGQGLPATLESNRLDALSVVEGALRAWEAGKGHTISGLKNYWMVQGGRFAPRSMIAAMTARILRPLASK